MSAHTRCDECRAEAPSQPFRLKGSCPEVEVCSWTCLAALVARKIKDRAIWDAKLEASLKAQAPVEGHDGWCGNNLPLERLSCDRGAGHPGDHGCWRRDPDGLDTRRTWP